jgi:hypothetical protein
LSQLKLDLTIGVASENPVSTGVSVLVEGKVLVPSQAHITHKFAQNFFSRQPEKFWVLSSVAFHAHQNNFQVAAVWFTGRKVPYERM